MTGHVTPRHEVTVREDTSPAAMGVSAACSCGWKSGWFGRHLRDPHGLLGETIGKHQRGETTSRVAVPGRHQMGTQFCGKWQQVVCECGWTGEPRNPGNRTFSRLIAADKGKHFWAVKNGENTDEA